ncbi:OB-fold domain-containing protein [Actinocorallia libanotica]|uniref:OB-fold nucleic acid binding domain-containing protein n=1 Tax=Actinocorallia libanotica TaxID=46162 RepID=A0ABN1RWC8_9ACTN
MAAQPERAGLSTVLEYPYTRTTGPVVGAFLGGLGRGRLLGSRIGGRVICPPVEYDPETGHRVEADLVPVGPGGSVAVWTWVREPTARHPFDRPFAFALILLDGADTPFVHAVDAGSAELMSCGMRVTARFADEPAGAITDVVFVPEGSEPGGSPAAEAEPVTTTTHLISLRYSQPLHPHRQRFVDGLRAGRIIGQRSPVSGLVYVPGRGHDQLERVTMGEEHDTAVADRGTVTSFTEITPVQYHGQKETEPYIRASILLDGASAPITGVDVRSIPLARFRVGLRLQAVWRPEDERDTSGFDNWAVGGWEGVFARWEPTGEPDVDSALLEEHVF